MSYGLKDLAEAEGFDNPMDLLEEFGYDSVVPGICTECGATYMYEPDSTRGWCDECEKNTVKSALILAGLI